jgi:hypothetical protein
MARRDRNRPPPPDDQAYIEDRAHLATHKAHWRRMKKADRIVIPVWALGAVGMGTALCWSALTDLRRGYFDQDGTTTVYRTDAPGDFYFTLGLMAAMGLILGVTGVLVLMDGWKKIVARRRAKPVHGVGPRRP